MNGAGQYQGCDLIVWHQDLPLQGSRGVLISAVVKPKSTVVGGKSVYRVPE
jgi:hypothetical protein